MVKSLSKSQLAQDYYNVDVKTLMRWINTNFDLLWQLQDAAYKPTNKIFTPKQIQIIRKHLG